MPIDITLPALPEAMCRDNESLTWFPMPDTNPADVEQAKALCGQCPEQAACLAFAVKSKAQGIWGGTTESERRNMRRKGAA